METIETELETTGTNDDLNIIFSPALRELQADIFQEIHTDTDCHWTFAERILKTNEEAKEAERALQAHLRGDEEDRGYDATAIGLGVLYAKWQTKAAVLALIAAKDELEEAKSAAAGVTYMINQISCER